MLLPATRRGAGQRINVRLGKGISRHAARKADEQHDASQQGGICKIEAQTAEQLLCHHDGDESADDGDPQRNGRGQVESQDHACDNGGEVPHRNRLFHHDAVQRFEAHTGRHSNARDQQCPRAENKRAGHQCGQQRDTHVEHKPPRAGMVGDMGGRGNDQFFAFHRYFFPPFLFFCHTALARFIVWVTGRLAGHT